MTYNPIKPRGFTEPLSSPISLAPMVGLTHSALRSLIAELGGCGLFFTEMLSAKRLPSENSEISPMLCKSKIERPLVYQLYISSVNHVQLAIKKVEEFGGDGIDINLGCPAPNLRREGAGAALAKDVKRVEQIVAAARKVTALPLSAKIRLGQADSPDKLISFCQMLEGEGVDYISVHARFDGEKFCRKPRWKLVAPICKTLKIPVFVNGGVFSVSDAIRCLEESEASGLMLGRGAVERPWLFNEIAREVYKIDVPAIGHDPGEIYFRFVKNLQEKFESKKQLGRLKQFTHYIVKTKPFGHHLAAKVQRSNSIDEAVEYAEKFYKISYSES